MTIKIKSEMKLQRDVFIGDRLGSFVNYIAAPPEREEAGSDLYD
jgi:hypothetical protein